MRAIILILAVLIGVLPAGAEVYQVASGAIRTLQWSAPSPNPASYDYYFLQMEDGRVYGRGQVPGAVTTIRFRTPGTYSLWVRACNIVDGARQCGEWAQSTDPSFGEVNSIPAPWLIKVVNP